MTYKWSTSTGLEYCTKMMYYIYIYIYIYIYAYTAHKISVHVL